MSFEYVEIPLFIFTESETDFLLCFVFCLFVCFCIFFVCLFLFVCFLLFIWWEGEWWGYEYDAWHTVKQIQLVHLRCSCNLHIYSLKVRMQISVKENLRDNDEWTIHRYWATLRTKESERRQKQKTQHNTQGLHKNIRGKPSWSRRVGSSCFL